MRTVIWAALAGGVVIVAAGFTARNVREHVRRDAVVPGLPWDTIADLAPYRQAAHPLHQDTSGSTFRVIVFSDYQCPACRLLDKQLAILARKMPEVSVGLIHYPLEGHWLAIDAAVSAVCAEAQGNLTKFNRILFSGRPLHRNSWLEAAKEVGIGDLQEYAACIQSDSAKKVVSDNVALGNALGVVGTPTMLIDNELYVGNPPQGIATILAGSGKKQ